MFKQNGTKSAKVQRVMLSPKKVAKHQATVQEVLNFFIAGHIWNLSFSFPGGRAPGG